MPMQNPNSNTRPVADSKNKVWLRVVTKLFAYVTLLTLLWVFLSFAFFTDTNSLPDAEKLFFSADKLQVDEPVFMEWDRRPLLVMLRSQKSLLHLQEIPQDELVDPLVIKDLQHAVNREQQLLVVVALGSDFGCTLQYLPASTALFRGRAWTGGFKDLCRGSRYDLAGRVFVDQDAKKNLQIVPHHLRDDGVLVIGEE